MRTLANDSKSSAASVSAAVDATQVAGIVANVLANNATLATQLNAKANAIDASLSGNAVIAGNLRVSNMVTIGAGGSRYGSAMNITGSVAIDGGIQLSSSNQNYTVVHFGSRNQRNLLCFAGSSASSDTNVNGFGALWSTSGWSTQYNSTLEHQFFYKDKRVLTIGQNDTITTGNIQAARLIGNLSAANVVSDTPSRAAAFAANGQLFASPVTDTELGYLSGVTSAVQAQLNAKANTAGLTLDANAITTGTISNARLPSNLAVSDAVVLGSLVGDGSLLTFTSLGVGTTDPAANLHVVGNAIVTGELVSSVSDARLKSGVRRIDSPLDRIAQLKGVFFTFNEVARQYGYGGGEQVGVIAQDVEAALPQAVRLAPFDVDPYTGSKSGQFYKTVQYEKLVPLLIEAVLQLQSAVANLEARMPA